MIRAQRPWHQDRSVGNTVSASSTPALNAACLLAAFLLLLISVCVLPGGNAWAASTNKADPDTATRKLTFEADDTENRWQFDGSENNYTRYRWVPDKQTGNLAYCINPGVTHGPGEGTQTYPARLLAQSDFKNEELYLCCLAALYYAPGGPGYKTEDGSGIGRTFFPDEDYLGGSFSFRDRFASAHVLMGYFYNDANWDKAFGGASDPSLHQPAATYKTWFLNRMAPKSQGGTGQGSFGELARAHLNDEDMVENGGYTLDAWKESVYLIMTGYVDDGLARQDMLTYLSAPTAPISVQKSSDSEALTKGNSAYSLAGAEYSVCTDKALENEIATMKTDANGTASTGNLVVGTYYVKETKPSPGFLLDKTVHAVKVKRDTGGTFTSKEPPRHLPLTALLGKIDACTQQASPQGMGSLAGAEFEVRHYAGSYDDASELPKEPTSSWTVTTDETGVATRSIDLPLGTYTVQEVRAPKGYQLDSTLYIGHIAPVDSNATGAILQPANYQPVDGKTGLEIPNYLPVAKDEPITCGFTIAKTDADLHAPTPQGDASLDGAVFSVVNESAHPVMVNGKSYAKGEECLTVSSERTEGGFIAHCDGETLPFGDYLITEKTPPAGYLANTEWSARITADESLQDGHIWDFTESPCEDQVIRRGICVPKIDHELQDGTPLGAAMLQGAEISVFLSSDQPVFVNGTRFEQGERILTMKTEADGAASTAPDELPYGTYSVRETREPTGYLLNEAWEQKVSVRDNGEITTSTPVDDQVRRGDIRFNKADEQTMERMGRVAFLITSKTTGESHVVVSDENGSVDTSSDWNPHTRNTNANDAILVKKQGTDQPTPDADDATQDPNASSANNGDVQGDEANRSDGNEGSQPEGASDNGEAGTSGNDEGSDGNASASDPEDENPDANANSGDATQYESGSPEDDGGQGASEPQPDSPESQNGVEPDAIMKAIADALAAVSASPTDSTAFAHSCESAVPNEDTPFEATVKTESGNEKRMFIMTLQEDGSIVIRDGQTDDEIVVIEPSETSVPTLEAPSGSDEGPAESEEDDSGQAAYDIDESKLNLESGVWFDGSADKHTEPTDARGALPYDTYSIKELRGAANEGMALVSFDVKVTRDSVNLDMGTVDDRYLALSTELTASDGSHVAEPSDTVKLVDKVEYTGLTPGTSYEMRGYLVNKENGEPFGESSTVPFTPNRASGSVDVAFEFDGKAASEMTLVAYQELYEGEELIAEHKDIDDRDETVTLTPETTSIVPEPTPDTEPEPEAEPKEQPDEESSPQHETLEDSPTPVEETPRAAPSGNTSSARQAPRSTLAKTGDLIGPYLWLFAPLVLCMGATGGYGLWRRRAFAYRPW
ncbi:MAG: SpaA isopeptide-forming pilin-related protein [Coriobacteriia bacterium]|nr:SpaA isopeptide-forming pilin-related protein [Coriobacteriia bacterium]